MVNKFEIAEWYNAKNIDYTNDLDFYKTSLNPNYPVVEFGSGTGRLSLYLIKNGFECYGIESKKEYRDYLTARLLELDYHYHFHISLKSIKIKNAQLILPFNFLFYLDNAEMKSLFSKISEMNFRQILFDVDNITTDISSENLKAINFLCKGKLAYENLLLIGDNRVKVKEFITKKRCVNEFTLHLHKSKNILNEVKSCLQIEDLFGDFNKQEYEKKSQKLISIMKKRTRHTTMYMG